MIESVEDISAENIEKKVKFNNLSDSIERIAIWSRYDVKESGCGEEELENFRRSRIGYDNEINQLSYFARYLGGYLERQRIKGNIVNYKIWANSLSGWSMFSAYNIPEEKREDFLKAKTEVYFNYCYGMLLNGQENIVKQGLYLTGMRNTVKLDNKYQVLFYLAVHCYIYYLAKRESDNCVSEKIRQGARSILEDQGTKNVFGNFLDMLAENAEWLDLNMPKLLHEMLDRYELFPMYENVKSMVMEFVVSDFYTFLILFMSHQYFLPELLGKNIDDMKAFRYVADENESKTKEMLKSLFKIFFVGSKSDERIEVEVELMYNPVFNS